MKTVFCPVLCAIALLCTAVTIHAAPRAKIEDRSRTPYMGAIVLDASSGKVLFEDNADAKIYPASVGKLMNLLVIEDKISSGAVQLTDTITVTAEVARMGGSQVYLKEGEVFTVEDLLYALMVQSANDAALALAIHVGGSKDGFVALMNKEAVRIGMKSTRFASVHGLPPSAGQEPDVSTARDFSLLALELCKRAETFKYTSVKTKPFRANAGKAFGMQNHNKLLWSFPGSDGLKTGYYKLAGFSIAVTAQRDGKRVIACVMGSVDRKLRDAKAAELLTKGFASLGVTAVPSMKPDAAPAESDEESEKIDFSQNPALLPPKTQKAEK
ncbi:MAG: D-alanyl-D-alanine carboxypeptidase family protein [Verrucomicrobiota bacterium]|nr:D-alanyl-D-alanine carboxypeptidase family protein [Verrucomicrobiota bacterium]